jgi:RNA recognition motif-containing protein
VSSSTIFLGNLPYHITSAELVSELAGLGHKPLDARIITDRETGNGRGFAFVEFRSPHEAKTAVEQLAGAYIGGRPVRADVATPRGGGGKTGRQDERRGQEREQMYREQERRDQGRKGRKHRS